MLFLKQSTSVVVQFGPFVDKTDGVTLEVGLSAAMDDGTTGIRLSKNGAALADRNDSTAPAYDAMGLYRITLDATDTGTLGTLRMIFEEAATTLPVWADFMIMPANVWDSMFGADELEVTLTAAGVDLIWDEVISGANHNTTNTSGRRIRELRESGFYSDGFIYIDTVNGVADDTNYEAGTEVNPVNNIIDANTIAASLGLSKFKITPGSLITLVAPHQNQSFEGQGWTLALGNQNIDGSTFNGAYVSGIAINSSGEQYFFGCDMSDCTLPKNTHVINGPISGVITIGETGDYFFSNNHSSVAGNAVPTLDINSVANLNISWRHYSGGLQIDNAVATTTMSYETDGQVIIDATCTSLNLTVRGNCSITDNGTTTNLTQDAAMNLTNLAAAVWAGSLINTTDGAVDTVTDITNLVRVKEEIKALFTLGVRA